MLVTELNPHIGYEKAARISLAAGAIAEIARQTLKMGFRCIHPKDTKRGVQW
jgi:fumarate hydratase class II